MAISIRFVTAVFTLVAVTNVIHAGCPSQSRVSAHRSSGYQTPQPFLAQQPTYQPAVFQHSQPQPQPQPVAPRIEPTATMPVSTTSPPTAQTPKSPKKDLRGSDEQKVTRHDVTVGEVVRLNHQLPAKSGIAVLKAGPIVLRVTLIEWTTTRNTQGA